MKQLTGTLVTDGSSDVLLKPILDWVLREHLPAAVSCNLQVPEWGRFPVPTPNLPTRLLAAQQFFTADVYFLHRDAEKESWQKRAAEIRHDAERHLAPATPYVRIVPVRMTEAWLLHNETAIPLAADRPNGRTPLALPAVSRLEALPDPKEDIFRLLREASELSGRHLRRFRERQRLHRLADLQQETGFAVLRALPAFRELEKEVVALAASLT